MQRLAPARLSRAAVARLVGGTAATSAPLYRLTAGNPFFVSEMAAAAGSGDKVPATMVDAVLARVQRLDPVERAALEQLCVAPPGVGASPDQILHRRTAAGDPRSHPAEATHDGEEIPGG